MIKSIFEDKKVILNLIDGPLEVTIDCIIQEGDFSYYKCVLESGDVCYVSMHSIIEILEAKSNSKRDNMW